MNEIQKSNLENIVSGIEGDKVKLLRNRYFGGNMLDEETMRESECCPIGYMVSLGADQGRELNPYLFFKRNYEPVGELPKEMVQQLTGFCGLSENELESLQQINDKASEDERKEAILIFLRKKIGA